jgi:hypothetical protein
MQGRRRVIDTSQDAPNDFLDPASEIPVDSGTYRVRLRSVVVLIESVDRPGAVVRHETQE